MLISIPTSIILAVVVVLVFVIGYGLWEYFKLKNLMKPNTIKVAVLQQNNRLKASICHYNDSGMVSVGNHAYQVVKDKRLVDVPEFHNLVTVKGMYVIEGNPTPIDLREMQAKAEVTSDGLKHALNTRVGRDIIDSLKPELITLTMAVVIICGAVAVVGIGLYYTLNQKLDVIIQSARASVGG